MAERRGSIAFFSTYRPSLPLDIYSSPYPATTRKDELHMTDGLSYNYNGQSVPICGLKTMLKHRLNNMGMHQHSLDRLVGGGDIYGMSFVSERGGAEELYFATIMKVCGHTKVQVMSMADTLLIPKGLGMEDHGCFTFKYFFYVTTMDRALSRRQPWTSVQRVNLCTGETDRITPRDQADLSPAVSPSGKKIAVASFQNRVDDKGRQIGWNGEIEDLQTNIFVMSTDNPCDRKYMIENGGWPTWGSDDVLFFHRKVDKHWGVFRADLRRGPFPIRKTDSVRVTRVTPYTVSAFTPAAIDETTVAVATIRKSCTSLETPRTPDNYRHIEVFHKDSCGKYASSKITQVIKPYADHYNPFVIDCGQRIGYHRCDPGQIEHEEDTFDKLRSPNPEVGLFRVSGAFPTFSKDGSKLAFVDNAFKNVYFVPNGDWRKMRIVFKGDKQDSVFSPEWSLNPNKDILYVCMGPSFQANETVNICAIHNVSTNPTKPIKLTTFGNNAFPCTDPCGKRLIFRSTISRMDGPEYSKSKNLYMMADADSKVEGDRKLTRVTKGAWIDTHCQWSPRGDWIVFSSTRDKPDGAPEFEQGLDPGYFAVYLMKVTDFSVVVRVIRSREDCAGYVNHPFFSPDLKSLVVTSDLAAVSADPMSMSLFLHSVRPYGDVFTVDIDPDNIYNNKDVENFTRITHSRYENATEAWTVFRPCPGRHRVKVREKHPLSLDRAIGCPFLHANDRAENWLLTGHLIIPKRGC